MATQKNKILLAGDDEETNMLFGSMLSRAGYDVMHNGEDDLQLIHAQEFETILKDKIEPELCSAEAARALAKYYKKNPPSNAVIKKDTFPGLLAQLGINEQAMTQGCFNALSTAIEKAARLSMPSCRINL